MICVLTLLSPLVVQTFKSLSHEVRQHHREIMVAEAQYLFAARMQQRVTTAAGQSLRVALLCSSVSL